MAALQVNDVRNLIVAEGLPYPRREKGAERHPYDIFRNSLGAESSI